MRIRSYVFCVFLCGNVFLMPLYAGIAATALAQDSFVGNIYSIESTNPADRVKIIRPGHTGIVNGKPGDAVFTGDTLKTGDGIKAQISMSDGSIVVLPPNSSVQMKAYMLDRTQGKRNSVMRAFKGTVRFVISRMFRPRPNDAEIRWKDSNVMIETINAIAGVRGTDFAVSIVNENEAEFMVLDGAVNVRNSNPFIRGDVTLGADQSCSVRRGAEPSQPSPLSSERKESLIKSTTLANPRTANGSNGQKQTKPKKYQDKDVARDLAAGMALSDVIDKAVESGMPIDDIIAALLSNGVEPGLVVYTAITEGYPPHSVVKAAIENGAPLNTVIASALGAGSDKSSVIAGATDAGVPPSAVANGVSNANTSGGLIYGNTTPLDAAPSSLIPSVSAPIGGGGGATPSTRPASPYRP